MRYLVFINMGLVVCAWPMFMTNVYLVRMLKLTATDTSVRYANAPNISIFFLASTVLKMQRPKAHYLSHPLPF